MIRTYSSWRWLILGCALVAMALTATARADEDGKGKGKGKSQPAAGKKPKDQGKGPMAKGGRSATNLPPGLAKKPADHPGRVAWLKAHSYDKQAPKGKGKEKGKDEDKGKGKDVESKLERLMKELQELRSEIKKKR